MPTRPHPLHYTTAAWIALGLILWIYLWPRQPGHVAVDTAPAWTVLFLCCLGASITGVGAAVVGAIREQRCDSDEGEADG